MDISWLYFIIIFHSLQCPSDFREMLQGVLLCHRLGLSSEEMENPGCSLCAVWALAFGHGDFFWEVKTVYRSLASFVSRHLPYSIGLCFCALSFSASAGLVMGEVFFMGSKSKEKCSHPGHSRWSQRSDSRMEIVMQRSSVMGALSQGLEIQLGGGISK